MKTKRRLALWGIMMAATLLGSTWLWKREGVSAFNVLRLSCFGNVVLETGAAVQMTMLFLPALLFLILEAMNGYEDFFKAGIYVFSRLTDRRGRLLKVWGKMAVAGVLFSLLWQGGGLFTGMVFGKKFLWDAGCGEVLSWQVATVAGWLTLFTTLALLIGMLTESVIGILASGGLSLCIISTLQLFAKGAPLTVEFGEPQFEAHRRLIPFHPAAWLVLPLHSLPLPAGVYESPYPIDFPQWPGCLVLWGLCGMTLLVFLCLVNRLEIYGKKK